MKMIGLFSELEPTATASLGSMEYARECLPESDVDAVVAYLRAGQIVSDSMELVQDPWNDRIRIPGGSGLQSDGTYVWRQDLWHYVQSYRVRLPAEFVERAKAGTASRELQREHYDEAMNCRARALRSGRS